MSRNFDDPSLSCSVKLNYLDSKGCTTRSVNNSKSLILLGRNEFRDLMLKIECGKFNFSFGLKGISLHTRFVKEGKATISLTDPRVQIMISNCPTGKLSIFLKTLFAKSEVLKKEKPVGVKERLLSSKPPSFEEISPLTVIDVNVLNNRLNTKPLKQGSFPETPKSTKRKFSEVGQENSPSRKISVKRPLIPQLLTIEQKNVLSAVLSGRNVFFTGSAGTGKSFLLKRILSSLPPDSTFATASTGVAACQIGGMTLHAFAGIGAGTSTIQQSVDQALRKAKVMNWKQCQHLIVDEISMIGGDFFQKLERIARVVKKNDKPFGGIQLILSGDFLQLPPVCKRGETRKFCFQTPAWQSCIDVNIELHKVKRQTDQEFIKMLQDVRMGRASRDVIEKLRNTLKHDLNKDGILATKLSTHKDDVEIINQSHLEKLPGELHVFYADDNSPGLVDFINNHCPVPEKIELKVGAQVMLTKNMDVQKGLVNGARGVVVGFEGIREKFPVVKFVCGAQEIITYEKHSMKAHSGTILTRKMLPLKLAWAMSIHKSQGMTLDCVEVSLSRVFECGQAYVALSRAKSVQGLKVLDIEPSSIRADPTVLKFYSQLQCSRSLDQTGIEDFL